MIEINLSPTKKEGGIANFAGIDFSQINLKMMIIAAIIWYVPEPILIENWDNEKASYDKEFQAKNKDLRKLQGKIRSMQNVQKQVEALKEQEEKLKRKLSTVKKIINKRQNPYNVLKYIAENIPPNVWLTKVEVQDKNITMIGYAKTWKNIGDFLESLKSSIFFSRQVNYKKPDGARGKYKNNRVEVFEIKTQIVRFK